MEIYVEIVNIIALYNKKINSQCLFILYLFCALLETLSCLLKIKHGRCCRSRIAMSLLLSDVMSVVMSYVMLDVMLDGMSDVMSDLISDVMSDRVLCGVGTRIFKFRWFWSCGIAKPIFLKSQFNNEIKDCCTMSMSIILYGGEITQILYIFKF